MATTPVSISRSAKDLAGDLANDIDPLRLCEPRLRRFFARRPKNDTSSSSFPISPSPSPSHDMSFTRGLCDSDLPPLARPKSHTFTTRPPSLLRPHRMFADLMSLCHTPQSCRYFTALDSWCISDRTSSADVSPRKPYRSPPVAYSNTA